MKTTLREWVEVIVVSAVIGFGVALIFFSVQYFVFN